MGSTGDPPVPVGDPPTGTEPDRLFPNQHPSTNVARDLPSGLWPDAGTICADPRQCRCVWASLLFIFYLCSSVFICG
jgi:hypothetical protein